jgi:hypothetical protein
MMQDISIVVMVWMILAIKSFIDFPIFRSDYMPRRGNNVNDRVVSVDFFSIKSSYKGPQKPCDIVSSSTWD